ncbi:sigma 54-interacting transcriptional regulator [Dechloromonas sp. ZS-1]|uniref:sigma 54-interacting transcriptional regulator n=1 Tax=Dechloromonas sp. ZS-1 TaxID=3138067 RepID=UPI0031FC6DDF
MNHSLIGQHPCMTRLRDTLARYASLSLPILLLGESGCGKEIAARDYLHAQSIRQDAPWLAINCASLSPELLESTLFGHKKGAFTGAHQDHDGYFTQAANGTLFLDEVGDLPLALQVKLLRVLENGEYHRLGDTTPRYTKARIIAATNRDLRAMILAGQFREDLYHRLNVLSIRIPPLSARGNDRWLLLEHFPSEQAETQLRTYLAHRPGASPLHFALGNQLAEQGRWHEAHLAYTQALRGDSNNPDYRYNLAVSLDRLHQSQLARHHYRLAQQHRQSRPAFFSSQTLQQRLNELDHD